MPGVTVLESSVARFHPIDGEAYRAESGVEPVIEQARWIRDEERYGLHIAFSIQTRNRGAHPGSELKFSRR